MVQSWSYWCLIHVFLAGTLDGSVCVLTGWVRSNSDAATHFKATLKLRVNERLNKDFRQLIFTFNTLFFPPRHLSSSLLSGQRSPEREKKLVFLTARVHPGESPASFICQGKVLMWGQRLSRPIDFIHMNSRQSSRRCVPCPGFPQQSVMSSLPRSRRNTCFSSQSRFCFTHMKPRKGHFWCHSLNLLHLHMLLSNVNAGRCCICILHRYASWQTLD